MGTAVAFSAWGGGKSDKPNDNLATPEEFYAAVDREFHFDHDPCPINPPGLREKDGLGAWGKRNWVNPPYSEKEPWILKAIEEAKRGSLTVMLLPVDTSTGWFHDLILPNCQPPKGEIRVVRGRLSFYKRPAKFGSMLCIFWPRSSP